MVEHGSYLGVVSRMEVPEGLCVCSSEALVGVQVNRDVWVGDKGEGVAVLQRCCCHPWSLEPDDDVDGVALVVDTGVMRPACSDCRRAVDVAALFKVLSDHCHEPLGDTVGTSSAETCQGVPDVLVEKPFYKSSLIGIEVDAWYWPECSCRFLHGSGLPDVSFRNSGETWLGDSKAVSGANPQ